MARIVFVTGTSPDVRAGSGTFVGISVLRRALLDLGHAVLLVAPPSRRTALSLGQRLIFNIRARSAVRQTAGADAVVGFDLDGVFIGRGAFRSIAAVKGVTAEEAAHERGVARVRLTVEAFFEGLHVRGADRVVATSAHSAARIVSDYGVPADRIAIVPEPIDLPRWKRALADSPALETGDQRILCVAHLYPRKDVATLLRAIAKLPGEFRLRVVGTGPERSSLERIARELGIACRVDFLGHVPFAALAAEYRRARVFCLPSRQEGFGIVFLEAMAAGLPIVAVCAAAVSETVLDGETGKLVSPGDADALASALALLLKDGSERRRLGEGGLRRVEAYDAQVVAKRFLEAIGLG